MRKQKKTVKIVCQGFYPDIVAAGELLFELSEKLVNKYNVDISVITAQPNFVKKDKLDSFDILNGVKIKRLNIFKLNKNKLAGKIFNSWSFFIKALITIILDQKSEWLLIPTCPPLLPLIGTITKFLYGQKYIYLMHDIYPEIAVKLGYLNENGIVCKIWNFLNKIALNNADKIIVLSNDMKDKLVCWIENIDQKKIEVIHNWSNENLMKVIPKEENYFIDKYSLKDKFIVEYSGNFGKIHEFNTLLEAARNLKENKNIVFLFIGDGGKKFEIKSYIDKYDLKNVILLPYQERSELAYSLGAADIHVLSIEEGYEKLAVPSKFYGILASGRPVIFIGSEKCHISEIIEANNCGFNILTGDSKVLSSAITYFEKAKDELIEYGINSRKTFEENFTLDKAASFYLECMNEEKEYIYNKNSLISENSLIGAGR